MEYTLMHKNIQVADLDIISDTGRIVRIFNLQSPEHLPIGVNAKDGMSLKAMDTWWTSRCIPASRDGIRDVLAVLNICNTESLLEKCFGLSLSDQYWVCPKGSGLRWKDINFFDNNFSKDMGEILFGREPKNDAVISFISPDNTSDGWLRKKWIIADGKRFLMKGGSRPYMQEPFNEVIACAVMRRLNIPHVDYTLTFDDDKPYSLCENFITPETELIPAFRIVDSIKRDDGDSAYSHLIRCCEELSMPDITHSLDQMLVIDYIIQNEDRHYNNFGLVRNAETLEWLGFAPIYDNGTSLWYNSAFVGEVLECKPFKKSHVEQIGLVNDFSWFDYAALEGIGDECAGILSASKLIDDHRCGLIVGKVADRCSQVERISLGDENRLHDEIETTYDKSRPPTGGWIKL